MEQNANEYRIKVYRRKTEQPRKWRYVAVLGAYSFMEKYLVVVSNKLEDIPEKIDTGNVCLMELKELEAVAEPAPVVTMIYTAKKAKTNVRG